jgi:hypothetical protein
MIARRVRQINWDSNNRYWEQDLMRQNVLQEGQYSDLTIHNFSNCMSDILIQFENGAELQDQINNCLIGACTIGR